MNTHKDCSACGVRIIDDSSYYTEVRRDPLCGRCWTVLYDDGVECDCPECGTTIHHHDGEECCACENCPEGVDFDGQEDLARYPEDHGSCEQCGVNLQDYESDDGLCDLCSWAANRG